MSKKFSIIIITLLLIILGLLGYISYMVYSLDMSVYIMNSKINQIEQDVSVIRAITLKLPVFDPTPFNN